MIMDLHEKSPTLEFWLWGRYVHGTESIHIPRSKKIRLWVHARIKTKITENDEEIVCVRRRRKLAKDGINGA